MRIEIVTRRLTLDAQLRERIFDRLETALGRLERFVAAVEVKLTDCNGRRGGDDKQCRVMVALSSGHKVFADSTNRAAETAVDLAISQIAHTAARRLKRLSAKPAVTYGFVREPAY